MIVLDMVCHVSPPKNVPVYKHGGNFKFSCFNVRCGLCSPSIGVVFMFSDRQNSLHLEQLFKMQTTEGEFLLLEVHFKWKWVPSAVSKSEESVFGVFLQAQILGLLNNISGRPSFYPPNLLDILDLNS